MSRVYVGNLSPRVSEADLEDEFRVFGVIRRYLAIKLLTISYFCFNFTVIYKLLSIVLIIWDRCYFFIFFHVYFWPVYGWLGDHQAMLLLTLMTVETQRMQSVK